MKNNFRVKVLSFSVLQEIEGAHTANDYAALLDALDFGDIEKLDKAELRDMCVMCLQELEPQAAAAVVLRHVLGDELKAGQISNIASEMLDEKLWEHYTEMSLHERMFKVGSLLYAAFPQSFPEPDAVRVKLEVVAANAVGKESLAHSLNESFLVRLLADGMDGGSVLHRLFDEQLAGKSFPEADTIVWIVRTETMNPDTVQIDVTSSGYWLDSLRDTKSYESAAYADVR